ncbi:hypothetical protein RHS01_05937 [Rhizoctonia solani]|uniref:Uncharacterized protein n=1 Tax=Rhizoctonia solani TaxID=456999 RepID=A0A8H7IA26_9AGAM|nr:hypothetical protein RHS01_05937 [Rhizoctonia solani]
MPGGHSDTAATSSRAGHYPPHVTSEVSYRAERPDRDVYQTRHADMTPRAAPSATLAPSEPHLIISILTTGASARLLRPRRLPGAAVLPNPKNSAKNFSPPNTSASIAASVSIAQAASRSM